MPWTRGPEPQRPDVGAVRICDRETAETGLTRALARFTASRDEENGPGGLEVLLLNECVERGPELGTSRVEVYDLTFRLHEPWMHERTGMSRWAPTLRPHDRPRVRISLHASRRQASRRHAVVARSTRVRTVTVMS